MPSGSVVFAVAVRAVMLGAGDVPAMSAASIMSAMPAVDIVLAVGLTLILITEGGRTFSKHAPHGVQHTPALHVRALANVNQH